MAANRVTPDFAAALADAELTDFWRLTAPSLGGPVVRHRSSWVRRVEIGRFSCFVKTYDYPSWRDRLRGVLRTTWLAPSRANREWQALDWLRARRFVAPEPLAVFERRRWGVLRRAVLVTAAFDGEPLDVLLPQLSAPECDEVLGQVERFVEALHAAGFRDRNLDLRNLLGRRRANGEWEVTKIDSPRHRIVPAGPAYDRAAAADWNRLARSLAAAGLLSHRAGTGKSRPP